MPPRPSCAPTSRPAWRRRSAPTPAICICAASSCCCSVRPSARWMRSACILCSSTLRCSMYRRILRRRTRPIWPVLSRRRWPRRWRLPIRTLTFAPLPTCMTGAAPTIRRGTRSSTSTTLPARCPTRRHRWRPLPQCGSRTPRRRIRSGAKNCWALRWPVHRVPKRCWKAAQPLRPATRLQTGPTPPSCRTTPRG